MEQEKTDIDERQDGTLFFYKNNFKRTMGLTEKKTKEQNKNNQGWNQYKKLFIQV